ncbi:MAG: DUF3127 domain-containing protein, partial [Muribaculaceae bacterium]|nr:DUF3127 domain-containing protein [Muribaculaceae bacterium]
SKSSGKEWAKASLVIETEGQYPKRILLTNFKDAEKFAALQVSTKGTFHIEIESREWTNKTTGKTSWFTEVSCWKWEVEANAAPQVNDPYAAMGMQPKQAASAPETSDLPF